MLIANARQDLDRHEILMALLKNWKRANDVKKCIDFSGLRRSQ